MNHELRIGILVPQSKQYPSLDKEFIRGIKLSGLEAKYSIESIGLGADSKFIKDKIQKLSLQEDVNAIIGLLGHRDIDSVYEYVSAQGTVMLASDLGAVLPYSLGKIPGVYVNSFGLVESAFLLGRYLSEEKKYNHIATSSSYYDVGYGVQQAFEMSIYQGNSSFAGHYITPFYPREDEAECMTATIAPINPEVVFANHSGLYAEEHASFVNSNSITKEYPFYTMPFTISDGILSKYGDLFDKVFVAGSWIEGMGSDENRAFTKLYEDTYGTKPTVFSLLGYENGLILKNAAEAATSQESLAAAIDNISLLGPRGEIRFDPETNRTIYNHYIYRLSMAPGEEKTLEQTDVLENDGQFIKDITQKDFPEQMGGWHNAYLCH